VLINLLNIENNTFIKLIIHYLFKNMVTKEDRAIVIGVLFLLFLIIGDATYFMINYDDSFSDVSNNFVSVMSANSIKTAVNNFYSTSSVNQRIFLLLQFLVLILFIVIIVFIISKLKSKKLLQKTSYVDKNRSVSKTDIDILYDMLKAEKDISISDISRMFKVDDDVSMGWAKILEDANLALIDYPRFGKPVIRLFSENSGNKDKDFEIGATNKVHIKEDFVDGADKNKSPAKKIIRSKVSTKKRSNKKINKISKKTIKKKRVSPKQTKKKKRDSR